MLVVKTPHREFDFHLRLGCLRDCERLSASALLFQGVRSFDPTTFSINNRLGSRSASLTKSFL
jgi:hypothetical protein